ncbi:hypothetical protein [Polyangium mundeleinium]|uniref:Uncharacterized protein n=1 Tax=Polyangium mundeleinium TaxID=2995306 RepID=A0ABT5F6B0_9BACT|nr:hypothetical protein [Polyangium mundeleinium]MDC0749646.1 hypothetical protein [Polyangium mundeleinium]
MSTRRPRPSMFMTFVPAVLGLCLAAAGCGGGGAATSAPQTGEEAKAGEPKAAGESKAAEAAAPAPAADAAKAEEKPAAVTGKKEKFALPNVEIATGEEREKLTLAGKELVAEACLLDTSAPELRHEWFSQAIRSMALAPDGALIVLDHEKKVRRYVVQPGEPCKLGLDPAFGKGGVLAFPGELDDAIEVLADGTIVGFEFQKTHKYKDGKFETLDCSLKSIDPNGKRGWKSFAEEIESVDLAAECKATPWAYTGWPTGKESKDKPSIQFVRSWGKDVVVAASVDSTHYVAIHGADGKKKFTLGKSSKDTKEDGENICWARDADACAGGLCVVDSNCRDLAVWDTKGKYVGVVDINTLLGLNYSWPVDLVMAKGGVAYMAASHKEKVPENAPKDFEAKSVGLIFRIKGLN